MNRRKRLTLSGGTSLIALALLAAAAATAAGSPNEFEYTITDLNEAAAALGVQSAQACAINEAGQIVGFEALEPFIERSIFWDTDGTARFIDQLPTDNSNQSWGIAEDGTALCISSDVTFEQIGGFTFVYMDMKATLWSDGTVTNLNDLVTGGDDLVLTDARAMSPTGQIVGWAEPPGHEHPPWWPNGFLFEDGNVTDLGLMENPRAINSHNQIVGGNISIQQETAYLWDDGEEVWLHDDPLIQAPSSIAFDINDDGLIVGQAQLTLWTSPEPIYWQDRKAYKMIPEVPDMWGEATAVNNSGQVVGSFLDQSPPYPLVAFIWQDGQWSELTQFLPAGHGWIQLYPLDINDRGQIVGVGFRSDGWARAFLMTPVVDCPADINGDSTVDVLDLLEILSSWGQSGVQADINGDGMVDVLDLIELLGSWGPC